MAGRFSIDATFRAHDRITGTMGKIERNITGSLKRASRGLTAMNARFAAIHSRMRQFATAGLVAGGAVGLLAKNVIDTGAGFEEQMSAVGAVMLKTTDQITELTEKAKELGATTKFTGQEAGAAMEIMARAGFTTEDILAGVGGVLDAAAASGLEMAEVADHVSNAIKGMGLETSDAARVADVLALASSRTNSTIGTLGESLSNVASTARQLGVPLEDTVAAVALLQDVGLDASVAGSAMNTMLTKLAKPSKEVARTMKEMGVAFQDSKGNMLPLADVMANLQKAADESGGNMEQVAFFADLVGLRGQKAAANLKDLFSSGKFGELAEQLREADGAAKTMAELRLDNLKGDFTLLGSAVDAVKVELFETKDGALRDIVQGFTEWVTLNKDLAVDKVERFVSAAQELADVFGSSAIKSFRETRSALSGIFGDPIESGLNKRIQFAEVLGKIVGTAAALLPIYAAVVLATKVVTFVTWAARGAMVAYRVAVIAVRGAIFLVNAAMNTGVMMTALYKGTIWAVNVASRAAAVGQGILAGATRAASAAAGTGTVAFGALAAAVGAVTLAVGALLAAWDQLKKLLSENENIPLLKLAEGFFSAGPVAGPLARLEGMFKAVDEHQNELARKRASQPTAPSTGAQGRRGGVLEALTGVPTDALGGSAGLAQAGGAPVQAQLDPEALSQMGITAAQLKEATAALKDGERIILDVRAQGAEVEAKQGPKKGNTKLRLSQSGAL